MSLSMPRGPRVDDTASTTISQALMLLIIWGFPCEVSVPSFRRMMGACCSERGRRRGGRRRREEEEEGGGGGRRRREEEGGGRG